MKRKSNLVKLTVAHMDSSKEFTPGHNIAYEVDDSTDKDLSNDHFKINLTKE
jgi:hypothetical protein